MSKSPFFTIIIPTFNRAGLIGRAIDSVLRQTFSDWELIVVDDGSTDGTREVVLNYKDDRIRFFYKNNEERSIARNFGIQKAKGQYLCFLDSDDYFIDNHLEVHYGNIKKKHFPIAGFYSGTYMESGGLKREDFHLFSGEHPVITLWEYGYNLLPFSFHRDIFKHMRFLQELIYMEDLHLLLNVFKDFSIFPVFENTNVIVIHEERTSSRRYKTDILNQGKRTLFSIDVIIRDHKPFLLEHLSEKAVSNKKKKMALVSAKACLKKWNLVCAFYFMFRSLLW